MFAFKNKYFLIIESIKDIELRNINKYNKFIIIYRNKITVDNINDLLKFRKTCKIKFIEFYVANDFKLSILLNSDGIYLSSYNKTFKSLNFKNSNYKIIGSAHNVKEITLKIKQGCGYILLSKLFKVDYDKSSNFLGINKFNTYVKNIYNELVPLGGIKISNLNSLKNLNCNCIALLSEVKKKPANIINRLF
jgi:thiamine-phosphate pyrophosphorylase